MNKMKAKKNIILTLFLLFFTVSSAYSDSDSLLVPSSNTQNNNTSYFNLANIVDTLLNNETKVNKENVTDKKVQMRKDFINITSKFNQGNASVAYDEYKQLIDKIDDDTSLLTLSKVFYEIGFFSLGNKAIDKIVYKNYFYDNISDLEKSYIPKANLSQEDEIYFAKLYSSIYFDNSSLEAINELNIKKSQYQKNDYYHFMLSRAYFEIKKYNDALNSINKAISIASDNLQYQMFKIDILTNAKKYSDALKIIQKLEKMPSCVNFAQDLQIKKECILAQSSGNEKERKYHAVKKAFLEGNYEKVKKDCQNILNFDKDNAKIITLYAKSELASGNVERANTFFVNSYKLEKNNKETIIGIGDIKFMHRDYKNAVKMYKKAYSKDKNNYEIIIKLANAQREYAKNPKELAKLEAKIDKMPKNAYLSYYKSAISIAQKNDVLKEDFLKRALLINPLNENAIGALVELYLKNKNIKPAKGLIANTSLTLEKNYYYYYLCGLLNQALNKNTEAIHYFKTSLNLNPSFEIANIKLLKLIPDNFSEEI